MATNCAPPDWIVGIPIFPLSYLETRHTKLGGGISNPLQHFVGQPFAFVMTERTASAVEMIAVALQRWPSECHPVTPLCHSATRWSDHSVSLALHSTHWRLTPFRRMSWTDTMRLPITSHARASRVFFARGLAGVALNLALAGRSLLRRRGRIEEGRVACQRH